MPGQFSTGVPIDGPAVGHFAITPNDNTDLQEPIRAVYINGEGTVSYVSSRDGQTYTTGTLGVGYHTMFASRIRSTGTSATAITGCV